MLKKIFFLLLLFTSLIFNSLAQNGNLRGKIIDANTGETLIGVTVFATGTTMGTTTDLDGNYDLSLPAGTYNIQISYISYATQNFPDLIIEPGEVKILNCNLKDATMELEAVIVTAKAQKNTESAIQVMQKKSATMLDGISSQQMSRLGARDAASALRRVTGVSVQSGKYIFVRGLGDRYTKITMNEADVPAMDPEKNTVQMDIFPSNVIDNIIVSKTFTPDLPGESTGGNVNIVTKDFPEQFTLYFSAKLGYNPQANLNNDFLTYSGGNLDWFGLDDGTRDAPQLARDALKTNGQISQVGYTIPELEEITESFKPNMSPKTKKSGLNQEYKFSLGDQLQVGSKKLGYNLSLTYENVYLYWDNGKVGLYEEDVNASPWKVFDPVRTGVNQVNFSAMANISLLLNPNNKIGFRFLRNQNGRNTATLRMGYFYYDTKYDQDINLGWLERTFNSFQVYGKHVMPRANKMIMRWLVSYINMNQDEPDLRFFETLLNDPNDTVMYLKTNDKPGRFWREMTENNINGKVDFELPVAFSGNSNKIKFGVFYSYKERNLDGLQFDIQTSNTKLPTRDIDQWLIDDVISLDNEYGYHYTADGIQDQNNSYTGDQGVGAAYAMIDFQLVRNLRMVAGARLETSDITINNLIEDPDHQLYKSGELHEVDILPSIGLIWAMNEEMNLRLAGSKTIARPTFRELGTNYYDYKTGILYIGNQELQRSEIYNVDLRWEWFFKPGEKLAAGAFYKFFKNPIEQKLSTSTQNYEIKYVNTDESTLYGAEFEFRKRLDFWNPLRDFMFGGNFTYVYSVVKIPANELEQIHLLDPDRGDTRPMLGQAPYIINLILGYDNREIKLESNLSYNVTGEKLLLVTKGATPYIYEQPFPLLRWNISKGLGERWVLDFSINNILNSGYKAVHHFPDADYSFLEFSLGRVYSFKVAYQIN